MVYAAAIKDTPDVRNVWKLGFGDGEKFMDFYFDERYAHNYTLIFKHNEIVSSAAQIVPFAMFFCGEIVQGSYILGVVTHPEYRKRGQVTQLMQYSIKAQYAQEVYITTLIPQFEYLFSIYKKYGFSETFNIKETVFFSENIQKSNTCVITCFLKDSQVPQNTLEDLHEFYTKAYKKTDFTLLKSIDDLLFTLKEFLMFEGDIYMARDMQTGEIVGCGFLTYVEKQFMIKEFLYDNHMCKNEILSTIMTDKKLTELKAFTQENTEESGAVKPLGMARIVNVLEILKLVLKNNTAKFSLKIQDNIIEENTGLYTIDGCTVTKESADLSDGSPLDVNQLMDIIAGQSDNLEAAQYFEKPTSYMNLMLN